MISFLIPCIWFNFGMRMISIPNVWFKKFINPKSKYFFYFLHLISEIFNKESDKIFFFKKNCVINKWNTTLY